MSLPPCPDCSLSPRFLVDGKWTTLDKVLLGRMPFSVRPQHHRWCPSEDNKLRHFLRATKRSRARG